MGLVDLVLYVKGDHMYPIYREATEKNSPTGLYELH